MVKVLSIEVLVAKRRSITLKGTWYCRLKVEMPDGRVTTTYGHQLITFATKKRNCQTRYRFKVDGRTHRVNTTHHSLPECRYFIGNNWKQCVPHVAS